MILLSLTHKKPDWTVRTRSRKERWGYVFRASVGPKGETSTIKLSTFNEFHQRASANGYEIVDNDLASVLRSVEAGREPGGFRVVSVIVMRAKQDALRAAALAALPADLTPGERWASGLTYGRSSAWLAERLIGARRRLDDFDGAPQAAAPIDAESAWRCLTLLDEVPGARDRFEELRRLAVSGWSWPSGDEARGDARFLTLSFRHQSDWTPFLLHWPQIEAAVRAAKAESNRDPESPDAERLWMIADDMVKRHIPRESRVVARFADGGELSLGLHEFERFFAKVNPGCKFDLQAALDEVNANPGSGGAVWTLEVV